MSQPTEFIAEPEVVMLDLHAESGEAAVRALHERLAFASPAVVEAPQFLADLLARMRLAPVCRAADVALPHARTDAVDRLVFAVARTLDPIAFVEQHRPVRLGFLIGTPKRAVGEYLRAVAGLSRVLWDAVTREGLYTATEEAEFRALLSGGVAANR